MESKTEEGFKMSILWAFFAWIESLGQAIYDGASAYGPWGQVAIAIVISAIGFTVAVRWGKDRRKHRHDDVLWSAYQDCARQAKRLCELARQTDQSTDPNLIGAERYFKS